VGILIIFDLPPYGFVEYLPAVALIPHQHFYMPAVISVVAVVCALALPGIATQLEPEKRFTGIPAPTDHTV
jgi:hypothetical protein